MNNIHADIRRTLFRISFAYTGIVLVSLGLFTSGLHEKYQKLALAEARSFFGATVAMRYWNAEHGGLYLPISDKLQPNPYLDDPRRDLSTTDGLHLTKVNPAFMTRLVAARIFEETGVLIHLTSLTPIRPENGPDDWEGIALQEYAETGRSSFVYQKDGDNSRFRYLDGLRVEKPCLACHAKQGYKIGDVRGGISVTIPGMKFIAAARTETTYLWTIHGVFLVLGLGLVFFLGRRLLQSVAAVEESRAQIKKLEGLLPICSFCKKIRRENGDPKNQEDWQRLESYIVERAEVNFSHGICPECMKEHYPDFL